MLGAGPRVLRLAPRERRRLRLPADQIELDRVKGWALGARAPRSRSTASFAAGIRTFSGARLYGDDLMNNYTTPKGPGVLGANGKSRRSARPATLQQGAAFAGEPDHAKQCPAGGAASAGAGAHWSAAAPATAWVPLQQDNAR